MSRIHQSTSSPSRLPTILGEVELHAKHVGIKTKKALAFAAGLAPETLSRIHERGTCDFETLDSLATAAGMEVRVMPVGPVGESAAAQAATARPAPAGWANPNLSDDTKIKSVLIRAGYQDILLACGQFGVQRVMGVAGQMDLSQRPVVSRILEIIEAGFDQTQSMTGRRGATPSAGSRPAGP